MAAKLNKRTQDQTRAHIQASMLVKRIQDHVHGTLEMTSSQLDAAKYLVNQAIGSPRQSVQHTGDEGGPITYEVIREVVTPSQIQDTEESVTTH